MFEKTVVVVLNYNGEKCLSKTLRSLKELSYQNKEVVVIDNASTDQSFEQAQEEFPEYTYRRNEKNGGFAYGMNTGIRYALEQKAQYVWLFNYDALTEKETLTRLVEISKKNEDRILLSPLIEDEKKNIWFAGGSIEFLRMRVRHTRVLPRQVVLPTQFLTGCALFIPTKVVQEVGFLDEDFFLYYEDADYSTRARNKGIPLRVVRESRVVHSEESRYNEQKIYHLVFSGLIFFAKHSNSFFSFYQAIYVILRRLKNLIDCYRKKPGSKRVAQAYHDFYTAKKTRNFTRLC